MRDRITFSITTFEGSRHFELPRAAHRFALILVLLGAGVVIALIASALHLRLLVANLEGEKQANTAENREITIANRLLAKQLENRAREFREIETNVRYIESRFDMAPDPTRSLPERVALARTLFDGREQEFREIGDRVENLEDRIGLDNSGPEAHTLSERVDLANLSITQKQLMLASIPNGYPLDFQGVTSPFGDRIHPSTGRPAFHSGVDLRAPMRTEIFAPADGVVEFAGDMRDSGYGRLVILRHNFGFRTFFGHLDEPLVAKGEFVRKGVLIAKSGNTGDSVGPHLHYEVRFIHNSLNPAAFMEWGLENYDRIFEEQRVKWQSLLGLINQRLTNPTPPSLRLAQR